MTLTLLELEALVDSLNKTYSRNKMKIIAEHQTDHKEQTGHDIQQEIKIKVKGQSLETASFNTSEQLSQIMMVQNRRFSEPIIYW